MFIKDSNSTSVVVNDSANSQNLHEKSPTIRDLSRANPDGLPTWRLNRAFCIDWLQANVFIPCPHDANPETGEAIDYRPGEWSPTSLFLFDFEQKDGGTKSWRYLMNIYTIWNGEREKFASLEYGNRLENIAQNMGILKIENKFLYFTDLRNIVEALLKEFSLTFRHWSRIDVSCDFQNLRYKTVDWKTGEYLSDTVLSAYQFMELYKQETIEIKGGKNAHEKSQKVSGIPKEELSDLTVSKRGKLIKCITWGSYASGTKITMYNKSLEMRQKTKKPWIEQLWQVNGLDLANDVYRLEFSMRKDKRVIDDAANDTTADFTDFNLIDYEAAQRLYMGLFNRHFQFYVKEYTRTGKPKQPCRCTQIETFDHWEKTVMVKRVTERKKSSNMEKFYIKRLVKNAIEYKDKNPLVYGTTIRMALDLVELYNLFAWFKKTFPDVEPAMVSGRELRYYNARKFPDDFKTVNLVNLN